MIVQLPKLRGELPLISLGSAIAEKLTSAIYHIAATRGRPLLALARRLTRR
jgi:hypothetical protein